MTNPLDSDRGLSLVQNGIVIVIVVLLITFYMLFAIELSRGTAQFFSSMILLVIAVTLIAIFWLLIRVESMMELSLQRKR